MTTNKDGTRTRTRVLVKGKAANKDANPLKYLAMIAVNEDAARLRTFWGMLGCWAAGFAGKKKVATPSPPRPCSPRPWRTT